MSDASQDQIQAIVDRTGLSHVQVAAIAGAEREAELRAERQQAGRGATSTEWVRPSATDLPMINSRRSSGPHANGSVWRPPRRAAETCEFCDGGGYTKAAVPFGHPQFGVLVPCTCKLNEIAAKDARILRDLADELQRYRHCRLATYGVERPIVGEIPWGDAMLSEDDQHESLLAAYEAACAYVEAPAGWLYLYGPPGSGKTRLAACIANELAELRMRTTYTSTPGMMAYIQAGFADDSAGRRRLALQRVPLLVVDDLGAEHINEFSRVELGDLVNQRYNRELPTIFTSNEWFETLPVRIADRIAEMAQIVYLLVGSYRRLKQEDFDADR